MKKFKRIMALVIALAMVLGMTSMAAFAADPSSTGDVKGSITVENADDPGVNADATAYKAYKIFDVTYENGGNGSENLYAYTITRKTPQTAGDEWFDTITSGVTETDGVFTMTAEGFEGLVFTKSAADPDKYVVTTTSNFSAPAFAEALQKAGIPSGETANSFAGEPPVADNLDLGYYFVTTTTGTICNLTTTHPDELIYDKNEVPSLDKVIVMPDGADEGTDPDEVKNNDAAIGDVVNFKITTEVPSMVGYDSYYFIIKDTLSKGLDLLDDNAETTPQYPFTVKIAAGDDSTTYPELTLTRVYLGSDGKYYKTANGAQNTNSTDIADTTTAAYKNSFYVNKTTDTTTGETKIEIVFVNFIQYLDNTKANTVAGEENDTDGVIGSSDTKKGYTDSAITVTYSAQVDEDAVIGKDGNDNTAKLTYSNDPTETGHGTNKPDEPENDDVTGDTPESKTKTYVTAINLNKFDAQDTTKYLEGAEFQITATDLLNTVIESGEKFEKAPYTAVEVKDPINNSVVATETVQSGTYYSLKDGTYTTTAPTEQTATLYNLGDGKTYSNPDTYVKVTGSWVVTKAASPATTTYTAITDSNGNIQFTGLKAGTYTITELVAPDGYNILTKPITVVISAEYKKTANLDGENVDNTKETSVVCKWSAVDGDGNAYDLDADNNIIEVDVPNNKGTILPSTGGIGTTIFYVVGAILVIGAGVIMITRRRMDA